MWCLPIWSVSCDPFWDVRAMDPLPATIWALHLVWLPPGSTSSCPRTQPMILKSVFVHIKKLWMKILQLNLSNCTSADVYLMNYATMWTQTLSYFLHTGLSSLDPASNVDIVCAFPVQPLTFILSGIFITVLSEMTKPFLTFSWSMLWQSPWCVRTKCPMNKLVRTG